MSLSQPILTFEVFNDVIRKSDFSYFWTRDGTLYPGPGGSVGRQSSSGLSCHGRNIISTVEYSASAGGRRHVLDWTCKIFILSAISSPQESDDRRLIHERKVIPCHTFRGLTAGSAYITVRARHWNDCALVRRLSAPAMAGFRGTGLLD